MRHFNLTGEYLFFLHLGFDPNTHGSVLICRPDGSELKTLVSGLGTHPDGIALDLDRGHLYYTNMGADEKENDGFISRIDFDGRNNVDIIPKGITFTPKQCIIESVSQKLYWCDREGMKLWRANMDGSGREILYQSAEGEEARKDARHHCVGIAVDRERGKVFWTQKGPPKGGQGSLRTAGIDIPEGESPLHRSDVKVLMDGLPEPIDLVMDHARRVIYKTDRGAPPRGNTVSRIHMSKKGQVEEMILIEHMHEAIGLTLDLAKNRMFFTDLGGSLYTAALDGSDKQIVLEKNIGDLTGIYYVDFDREVVDK